MPLLLGRKLFFILTDMYTYTVTAEMKTYTGSAASPALVQRGGAGTRSGEKGGCTPCSRHDAAGIVEGARI